MSAHERMHVMRDLMGAHHFELHQMQRDAELVAVAQAFRGPRVMSSALPQELRFMMVVISTDTVPSSSAATIMLQISAARHHHPTPLRG